MINFNNLQFIIGGIIPVFCLWIGLRGLVFKKPFLISSRWTIALTICILINCLGPMLFVSKNSQMLGLVNIFIVVFIFLSILFRQQGYMVFGITNQSIREALFSSLKKLGIGYEETLGSLRLSAGMGELQVLFYGWTGTGVVRAKNVQDKNLLSKVAAELNLYFQTNQIETNKTIFVRYLIMGFLFVAIFTILNITDMRLHQNGWGKETYPDGSMYEGNFKDGERSGYGKIFWKDGRIQEGEYKDGELNGNVILKYPDGSFFKGVCRNGFEYCKGMLQNKEGVKGEEIKNGEYIENVK